jgi:hypothetical protein
MSLESSNVLVLTAVPDASATVAVAEKPRATPKCSLCRLEGHTKSKCPEKVEAAVGGAGAAPELAALKAELAALKAELAATKKANSCTDSYAADSLYGTLKKLGDELFATQNTTSGWRGTPLAAINELKADPAGKVGEELLKQICCACGIRNESTGDKNSKDGTYDQKIGAALKKVEIKTARLGGGKYQHESLKIEGCDYWLFVDIAPTGGCITILPRFDLRTTHPLTGTTPTLRKGTTDVFKWDFSELHLAKLVTAGAAMRFNTSTSIKEMGDFIASKIL